MSIIYVFIYTERYIEDVVGENILEKTVNDGYR